jgi:hypothetical protein
MKEIEMAVDLNLNNAECLREVATLSGRMIYNVCNGKEVLIPYGVFDYTAFVMMSVGIIVVLFIFLSVLFGPFGTRPRSDWN